MILHRLYFFLLPLDGFTAPQDPLPGHMDQFEEQTTPQQSFESAELSQGQCEFQWVANHLTCTGFSLQILGYFLRASVKFYGLKPIIACIYVFFI